MVYKWKLGSQFKISAQVAGERIDEIKKNVGRGLKAQDVVEDAKNAKSPLHKLFDWNDQTAANQHRLEVARNVLRSIITIYVDVTKPAKPARDCKVWISLKDSGTKRDRTFYPMAQVLSEEDKRDQYLRQAISEFKSWRDRYHDLKELVDIFEAGSLVMGRLPRKFKEAA